MRLTNILTTFEKIFISKISIYDNEFSAINLYFFLNQAGLESAAQVRDMAHGPHIEFSFPIQCTQISIFTENIGTLHLGKCVSFKCLFKF